MGDILSQINTRKTPQNEKARPDQVKNAAGGYVFQIGDEEKLHRFLTLGTDGNTYYAKAIDLTRANAEVVFRMAASKPDETIAQILAVSEAGRAPKNKQAIFALAIVASAENPETRVKALAVMHKICRTGTHLFEFNKYVEQFRGRGPSLNKAVARWYLNKPVEKLAYQVVKYRQREGWEHRDLLRLVKPGQYGPKSADRDALFDFIIKGEVAEKGIDGLAVVDDYLDAQTTTHTKGWVEIINRGHGLSWEMLPDAALKETAVWEALLTQGIPQTALMRQLPRLTNVFGGTGSWIPTVAQQLQNKERLVKGRVHPINVLIAQRTYASGHSVRGKSTWTPISALVDALDAAYYNAYAAVEPTGKRRLIALDVSGSMGSTISDLPITCREASAALALITLATEAPGTVDIIGFTSGSTNAGYGYGWHRNASVTPLDISPRRRLDDVTKYVAGLSFGGTDCALPFIWAGQNGRDYDAVETITDNETWVGQIHPHQALTSYRNSVGHDVKFIATAMTATDYSIADPKDASSMNVSGFDSAVPQLIGDFITGRL